MSKTKALTSHTPQLPSAKTLRSKGVQEFRDPASAVSINIDTRKKVNSYMSSMLKA